MENNQFETCQMCGAQLEEEEKELGGKYCINCGLMMSAGGAAHQMAERIRENKKQQEGQKGKND